MSTSGIDSMLVYFKSDDCLAEVLLALIQSCDPSLSFNDAKELAKSILSNRDVTKNSIEYILTKGNGKWILGVTIKK